MVSISFNELQHLGSAQSHQEPALILKLSQLVGLIRPACASQAE